MSATTYTKGQAVRLEYNGQTIEATVALASPNSKSLMVAYKGGLRTPSGGLMIGSIPLLLDDDGIYRDLADNAPATLTHLR